MRSPDPWSPNRDVPGPLADSGLNTSDLTDGDRLIFTILRKGDQALMTDEWQIVKQEHGVFILRRPSELAAPLILNHAISRENFLSLWDPAPRQVTIPQAIFEEMLRGGVYPFETLVEGELRDAKESVYPCHVARNNPGDSGRIEHIRDAVNAQLPGDVH